MKLRRVVWGLVGIGAFLLGVGVVSLWLLDPDIEDHWVALLAVFFFVGALSWSLAVLLGIVGAALHVGKRLWSSCPGRRAGGKGLAERGSSCHQ